MSPASAPAVPCLTDSCLERANYIYFPNMDGATVYSGPLLLQWSLPGASQRRQTTTNKQTWSTHSSLSVLWDSDHVAQSLSPCSPFLRSPPGCACLLNSLPLGKAVALRLHVRLYGSWYMLAYPWTESSLRTEPTFYTSVFWAIPGSRRDG